MQTASYITALLTSIRDRRGPIDDVPAAVKVRVEKQQVVYGNHKFAILLEAWEDAFPELASRTRAAV